MQDNPYAAPTAAPTPIGKRTSDYRVDGKKLVVRDRTVLPLFCIKTAEPITEEDCKTRQIYYCHPLAAIAIIIGGPLLYVLVYLALRRRCEVTYGVVPEVRRAWRKRLLLKLLALVTFTVAIPVLAVAVDSPPAAMVSAILALAALISLFFGNINLTIHKYLNSEFWMAGCSEEFLNSLHENITVPAFDDLEPADQGKFHFRG